MQPRNSLIVFILRANSVVFCFILFHCITLIKPAEFGTKWSLKSLNYISGWDSWHANQQTTNLMCQMEPFLKTLGSSQVSIWSRAHKRHLERGGKMDGGWRHESSVLHKHTKRSLSPLLLPVQPGGSNWMFPIVRNPWHRGTLMHSQIFKNENATALKNAFQRPLRCMCMISSSAAFMFLLARVFQPFCSSYFLAVSQLNLSWLERRSWNWLKTHSIPAFASWICQMLQFSVLELPYNTPRTQKYKKERHKAYVNKFAQTQIHMSRLLMGEQNGRWVACR